MKQFKEQVSRIGIGGLERASAGTGYIFVPGDIDRDTFIFNCFKNQTISYITENSERIDNVKVSNTIFKDLTFPKSSKELGSMVFWVNIPKFNLPIVVAVLGKNDEVINLYENQFELSKKTKNGSVSIKGDAKKGELFINIDSLNQNGGVFKININNAKKNGKLQLIVDGETSFDTGTNTFISTGEMFNLKIINPNQDNVNFTEIQYRRKTGFNYKDEFGNIIEINKEGINFSDINSNSIITNKDFIKILGKKTVKLGEGKEPILLGNKTSDLFNAFIDEVSKIQTTTIFGPMPILNVSQILALKEKVKLITSQYSSTD